MTPTPSPVRAYLAAVPLAPVEGRDEAFRLPTPLTSLVGRVQELATLAALLRDPVVRFVTLTGPGGVGKTRLALRLASELSDDGHFADGVAFVELTSVRDPDLVATAIAQALGLRPGTNRAANPALTSFLRPLHLCLVLDNFEQVIDAAPLVATLLEACPHLTVLVTSRTRLHVSGERAVIVSPLAVRRDTRESTRENDQSNHAPLSSLDAVQLFSERATAVRSAFALTEENLAAVTEVCRRLDGLPLAIELAAARSGLFTPAALLARLEFRLPQLTDGPRDQPARHRTMGDAIAWSHDLLPPDEQAIFRRLAVFAGGAALGAVEAVCLEAEEQWEGGGRTHRQSAPDVVAAVESLVRQSLLVVADPPAGGLDVGQPRLAMLETIREFAQEMLAASGEETAVRRKHAAWCLALVERYELADLLPDGDRVLAALEAEHANVRVALARLAEIGEPGQFLRLAAALGRFWIGRAHYEEGRGWLERALTRDSAAATAIPGQLLPATSAARAKALVNLGMIETYQRTNQEAETHLREGLALCRDLGEAYHAAKALQYLGGLATQQGDFARSAALLEECLAVAQTVPDQRLAGIMAGWALNNLADIDRAQGNLAQAASRLEHALSRMRDAGFTAGMIMTLGDLGAMERNRGEPARALELYREALTLGREQPGGRVVTDVVEAMGVVAMSLGLAEHGTRLLGAAEARRDRTGLRYRLAENEAALERAVAAARLALGEEVFAVAWATGRKLSPDQAVAAALELSAETPALRPPHGPLSPRELDVLRLLVAGLPDRAIAAELFLSARTVENHVSRIFAKLGVRTRTAAVSAAIAAGYASATPPPDA